MVHRNGKGGWTVVAGAIGSWMAILALLGACGDSAPKARATSMEDALGFDEGAFQEREAKVQEEIRRCMQEQGFDYVPIDASQMKVHRVGPGSDDNTEFRRTKGYGVTTRIAEAQDAGPGGDSDPNRKIREALSEADKKAYDQALFGSAADHVDGGEFSVKIGPGGVAKAGDAQITGCFGRAQEEAGEGKDQIRELGPKLQELEQRISSDPRMVKANAAWSKCMSDAGFEYEKPEDIVPDLMDRLGELRGTGAGGGDGALEGPVGPPADSPELDALRAEELALARADDECSTETGRRATAKKVRKEAERQFLEDNPNLGADNADRAGNTDAGEG